MAEIQLGAVEARFADIIWEREPVTSGELIKLAADKLAWKRTTTHTVLHRRGRDPVQRYHLLLYVRRNPQQR